MALQTPSPARVRTSRGGMTLRFPKEVVTPSLWKKIADMGWMQYTIPENDAVAAARPANARVDFRQFCGILSETGESDKQRLARILHEKYDE